MWTASSSGRALRTGLSISARWRRPSLRRTGAIEARLWSTRTRRLTLSSVCVGAESQWSNSLLKRLRRQVCAHSVLVVARRTARLAKRPRSTRRTGPGEAPQESTGFYRIDHAHGEHDDRVITALPSWPGASCSTLWGARRPCMSPRVGCGRHGPRHHRRPLARRRRRK